MLNWKHSDELSRSSLPRQKTRTGLSANSAWDWMMISLALDLAEEIVDFNSTMLSLKGNTSDVIYAVLSANSALD